MKNNAFPLWPDYPSYHYEWSDGSFVNYSQLQFADGEHLACVCFKTGQKSEKSQWVTMDCSKPTQMATAVCQKSPKEA
ncbi:hypothetical protein AAVH_36696 [Aphelenchoides avenae]|nr:hypothetical protein AAVH_36696 [Aphelenchus avenae]